MIRHKPSLSIAELPAGRYVTAVSGGVDSMVLLDILRQNPKYELIVAHFDHGVRADSAKDKKLVERFAMSHNILFVSERMELGAGVSEETARRARYNFLRHVMATHHARAIIMAHHQDDQIETAIINLLRGTGRRGLSALASHDVLLRPLLSVSKSQIIAYAKASGVPWREDLTNQDQSYLRNYVRHNIVAKFSRKIREGWLQIIVRQSELNAEIDTELTKWLDKNTQQTDTTTSLPRYQLIMLPAIVAYEIFQQAVKQITGKTLEQKQARAAILFAKTAKPGKRMPLGLNWQLRATKRQVIVEPLESMVS